MMLQLSSLENKEKLIQPGYYSYSRKELSGAWLSGGNKNLKEFITPQPQNRLQQIFSIYNIEDLSQVILYLAQNSMVVPLLLEANTEIKKLFPMEKLYLKVSTDPEDTAWKLLVISILVKADAVDEAINKLEQLDDNWFAKKLISSQANLCINLDFE